MVLIDTSSAQRSDDARDEYLIAWPLCWFLVLRSIRNTCRAKLPADTFAVCNSTGLRHKNFTSRGN